MAMGGGCTECVAELCFTERVDSPGPADWHLHYLRSLKDSPDGHHLRGDDERLGAK
jgi:hypothetical protein